MPKSRILEVFGSYLTQLVHAILTKLYSAFFHSSGQICEYELYLEQATTASFQIHSNLPTILWFELYIAYVITESRSLLTQLKLTHEANVVYWNNSCYSENYARQKLYLLLE
jgi:hypothetical protein